MSAALRIGFIPLVDCAPLVVAHELGFAREQGIEIALQRESSWSNIRDRLAVGLYEAAHLLAPMAVATNLGLAGPDAELTVPYVLNLNGDVLGAASGLLERLEAAGDDPASALIAGIRSGVLKRPLTFGVPFFFSTHHYLLRYWLAHRGVDPEADVRIQVIPPPLMAEAIGAGVIDAFLVGEPWGSVSVDAGIASIVLPSTAIWQAAPEKVLGLRRAFAEDNRDLVLGLIRALHRASMWCGDPSNHVTLSEILARPRYLDVGAEIVERALTGRLTRTPRGHQLKADRFLMFRKGAATFPWKSQGLWILGQMGRWGHADDSAANRQVVRATFDAATYRAALAPVGVDIPGANAKLEGALSEPTPAASSYGRTFLGPDRFCDGLVFDPDVEAIA